MKVQFHKSQYSTVGRSSCLVHVQCMDERPTKNTEPVHVYVCIAIVDSYVYCVCVWVGGWLGRRPGVWVEVTLCHLAL